MNNQNQDQRSVEDQGDERLTAFSREEKTLALLCFAVLIWAFVAFTVLFMVVDQAPN